MQSEPTYTHSDGLYHFHNAGETLFSTKEVSVLIEFTEPMPVMHKHGVPENVNKAFSRILSSLSEIEDKSHINLDHFKVFTSDKFDVEELNKLINISGYGQRFIDFHEKLNQNTPAHDEGKAPIPRFKL